MNTITQKNIEAKILTIRGVQVILDKDLASFYEVTPIRLREQVKRNANRFPADFVFYLNEEEVKLMVSQNAIPSKKSMGGHLPLVFTEQGVAAVSGILKSDKAAIISIQIVRAFVAMRKTLSHLHVLLQRLDGLELKQVKTDLTLEKILNALECNELPKQGIFYHGQIFDAYKWVSELFRRAKHSIIIFDNYIDDSTLIHLQKRTKGVKAIIFTSKLSDQLQLDINKFNEQYEPIYVKIQKDIHDRFVVIDHKELYHIGASLKDLGKKLFAFTKMEMNVFDFLEKAIGVNVSDG